MKNLKLMTAGFASVLLATMSQAEVFQQPISDGYIFPYPFEDGSTHYFSVDFPTTFTRIDSVCLTGDVTSGELEYLFFGTQESYTDTSDGLGLIYGLSDKPPSEFNICGGDASRNNFIDGITNIRLEVEGLDVVLDNLKIVVNGNAQFDIQGKGVHNYVIFDQFSIDEAKANGLFSGNFEVTLPFAVQNVSGQELVFEFNEKDNLGYGAFGAGVNSEDSSIFVGQTTRLYTEMQHLDSISIPIGDGVFKKVLNDGAFSIFLNGSSLENLVSISLRTKGHLDYQPLSLVGYLEDHSSKRSLPSFYFIENNETLHLPMRLEIKKLYPGQLFDIEAWTVIKYENGDQGLITIPLENRKTYALGDQLDLYFDLEIDSSYPSGLFEVEYYVRKLDSGIIMKETVSFYTIPLVPLPTQGN
jgi:hypothetical protein